VGRPYTEENEKQAIRMYRRRNQTHRKNGPEFSLMKTAELSGDDGGEDPVPVRIAGDDFDPDDADEAKELYKSTMQGLLRNDRRRGRTSTRRRKEKHPQRMISPGPRTALIPAPLDVHEDWMEDDLGGCGVGGGGGRSKRKRDVTEEIISRVEERSRRRRRSVSPTPAAGLMRK
jgi:hypothetical protein